MPTAAYPGEFIAKIMRDFRIPEELAEKLKFRLEQAARIYRLSGTVPATTEQQLFETRKGLERVDETFEPFAQALESLSHHARDRLWDPAFADPIRRRVASAFAQFDPNNYPDEKQFRTALDAFGRRIRERLDDFPKIRRSGGRPKLTPLHNWVALIARFWSEELKREFTYSELARKHSTFDFCWRLVREIDGNVGPAQLSTAMRAIISPPKQKAASKRKSGKARKRRR